MVIPSVKLQKYKRTARGCVRESSRTNMSTAQEKKFHALWAKLLEAVQRRYLNTESKFPVIVESEVSCCMSPIEYPGLLNTARLSSSRGSNSFTYSAKYILQAGTETVSTILLSCPCQQ